jgi:hypothetical protein
LGTALLPEGEWRFDVSVLAECLARPAAWKREHGFPEDVRGLAAPAEGESVRSAWARVLVDRPEQLMGLAVQPADEENVVGFAVPSSGGPLRVDEPAFRLSSGWRDEWPELTAEPTTDAWREAWREWGHSRNLAAGDLEACRLEPSGVVLRVSAPGPFLERLRATRSDVFKSDTWLLAGTGSVRRAALIELVGQP